MLSCACLSTLAQLFMDMHFQLKGESKGAATRLRRSRSLSLWSAGFSSIDRQIDD